MNWSDIFLFCFAIGSLWAVAAVLMGGLRVSHMGHAHSHVGHFHAHGGQLHAHGGGQAHQAWAKVDTGQTHAGQTHTGQSSVWGHLVSPSCIAIFLAWFGGVGYVLERHSHMQFWADILVATAAGLTGASILARFLSLLQNRERVMNPADYEMVGTLGQVASAIRPAGVGEVFYVRDGARRAVPARSEDDSIIPRGTEVIVLRYEKGVAYVRTWDAMTQ